MITGHNSIVFNEATMKNAIQHYFDTVLFAKGFSPKVESIAQQSSGSGIFTIRVTEAITSEKENQE